MSQLHKRFTTDQIKGLLSRYLGRELKASYLLEILGIKRRRFFGLLKEYRKDPNTFSIDYPRHSSNRFITLLKRYTAN